MLGVDSFGTGRAPAGRLDTSVWINHIEGSTVHGRAADGVLEAVSGGSIVAVASELVLLELLVAPLRKGSQDVADEIEMTLMHLPHLQLAPVTRGVLVRAAEIHASHGLRTPDAIMVSTAIEMGATLAAGVRRCRFVPDCHYERLGVEKHRRNRGCALA